MQETFFTIDWSKVNPDVLKALQNGQSRIVNGVARNVKDNSQILQHMPFKELTTKSGQEIDDILKAVQGSQQAMAGLMAISTVAIIGAVVVATAYISNKLDKIQEQIEIVLKEIHDQNILYYLDKITSYFAAIEALRELMKSESVIEENRDLVLATLSHTSILRNHLLSFIDNIIFVSDGFEKKHKELVIKFLNSTLQLLPKAIFIESQAAYKLERYALGDCIKENAKIKYDNCINNFKIWLKEKRRNVIEGKTNSSIETYRIFYKEIEDTINSEENELLLKYTA
jgi:hypothetical protein